MKIFYPPIEQTHAPTCELDHGDLTASPDSPARTRAILDAIEQEQHGTLVPVDPPADTGFIAAVHDVEYLAFLQEFWPAWEARYPARREAVPHTFALRDRLPSRPPTRDRQIGWWVFDTGTPLLANTWEVATASAHAAFLAANELLAGAPLVYALCRPPGHHSASDAAGGYCYLNNAAIAAHALAGQGRVALIDIDYHHGNGTQEIFYARSDVLFASLHADPARKYPYFSGFAHEQGMGEGEGFTLNVPLPAGVDDQAYLEALMPTLEGIARYDPAYVVISAGFDIYTGDPLGDFAVSVDGIHAIARQLAALDRPLLVAQEGGYAVQTLGSLVTAFLSGIR